MSKKIKIFDTTLRDGEQAPGFSMNLREKLLMARQLEKLGVDVIEAGFASASPEDFESVKRIGEMCSQTEVCGLARCHKGDIEATVKALSSAAKPRIHVFIATSDIHLEHKLKMSRDEAVKRAIEAIKMAKQFTDRVDFSPEDATRSDYDFLKIMLEEAIKAGADTLNIPDTVGYSTPNDFGDLINFIYNNVEGAKDVIISTHCHNDLGLAAANSLAGVLNGATQIECTINGIGERAGNASLEEVVMAMRTRPDVFDFETNINSKEIFKTSNLLAQITGQNVQVNKAIVGKNAFAHESGIHQHGVLANRLTYEILKPEDIGLEQNNIVLGKHSGRNALNDRLKTLGIEVDADELLALFKQFKSLADKKKNIYDEDLIMMAMDYDMDKKYQLLDMRVVSVKDSVAHADGSMQINGETVTISGEGDGPVSALYAAIANAASLPGRLVNFKINAITPDREAIGLVKIQWKIDEETSMYGHGSDTDITIAAGKALIDVLNRLEIRKMHMDNRAPMRENITER